MRLVDADKMLKRIESWNTSDAMDKALYNFTLNWIVEQHTIDAVPVEYILKQIAKLERSKGQSYHAICYRHLIEVWEMENEREEE